ncbi:MAG: DsrE family protein [Halanaeroarchaeum sp.]
MRAVFHHSNDDPELHGRVLANTANLLDDESVEIEGVVVVTNSGGLHLVTADSEYAERIGTLRDRGVAFRQCGNTMDGTDIDEDDLVDGVEVVPSGVGELARLQEAGYAYLKP